MSDNPKILDIGHAPESMDDRFWRHARFPKHLAAMAQTDAEATAVGACGDVMGIRLKIENERITGIQQIPDGCVYTVACASAVSDLALGAALEEALEIQPDQVAAALGGLPEDHLHCARLAVNTLGEAIANYYERGRRHAPPKAGAARNHTVMEGG